MTDTLQECITHCWNCRTTCAKTLYTHCLYEGGEHAQADHVRLMTDCIQICQTAADFMVRQSPLHTSICAACAEVCDSCAQSCESLDSTHMRECAEACRQCAQSCREMGRLEKAA